MTSLKLLNSSNANFYTFTITIREGAGFGGNVLYTGAHNFWFDNPKFTLNPATAPMIVAGQVYTIDIVPPVDGFGFSITNGYAGGAAIMPGYPGNYDLVFSVFVTPGGFPGTNVFMDQQGHVGINTTSPSSTLEVASGDVELSTAGRGVILRSPDGASCRRISIDNGGALVLTVVGCQ